MDTKNIQNLLKNNIIEISNIIDIILLQDESVLTLWISKKDNKKRIFATLKNQQKNKCEILELYNFKNCNKFKKYIPLSTFLSTKSYMETFYLVIKKA